MDKFEKLAHDSTFSVGLIGNPASRNFELIDLAAVPLPEERVREFQNAGFQFIGVIGFVDGAFRVALDYPLDEATVTGLAQQFVRRVEEIAERVFLQQHNRGDSAAWLQNLFNLPDSRNGVN